MEWRCDGVGDRRPFLAYGPRPGDSAAAKPFDATLNLLLDLRAADWAAFLAAIAPRPVGRSGRGDTGAGDAAPDPSADFVEYFPQMK
jgi:hypothetical protein